MARILGHGERQRTRAFAELQSHYLFLDRFGRPQQVGGVVRALGRALPGQLVVLAQEGRQLERLEVVRQQELRGVAHAAAARPSSVM